MARLDGSVIEPVGADLVALAQAHALDVTMFPHSSLPVVFGIDLPPVLFVARAERGAPVVGFVATRARDGVLEITGLAVDRAHQRAGLGRALVKTALRSARQRRLSRVALHVSTANAPAIALYESEGFRRVERLTGFYPARRFPDDGDAWLMVRRARR
ncbi:MAG TPA: GNAT family N-acetyltransferase [Labilithrix sp.]|nr:GNAT family N-acetyltransferase [Labilithrix sp.]